ncbi:MAG TPA: hypothetical protein PKE23_12060, partial [Anaerolineales bacterium]|nr:hypothetical protein [Anaerolineales bacterium]
VGGNKKSPPFRRKGDSHSFKPAASLPHYALPGQFMGTEQHGGRKIQTEKPKIFSPEIASVYYYPYSYG